MADEQIRFSIGFKVDESGLKQLRQELAAIQQLSTNDIDFGFGKQTREAQEELNKIKNAASAVEAALQRSFNQDLGTYNLVKFRTELTASGHSLTSVGERFSKLGAQGNQAWMSLVKTISTSNVQLKQTWGILSKLQETFANTIKWNIASSAVNGFTSAIRGAFSYVESLDRSLTSIRVVTGDSREEMAQFAVEANNAAQALGRQTKEYTNAALTFYQQGLNDEQVRARTEAVLKAQNITNSGSEMADYLTAVWNGFRVSAENTVEYVDKLAAVADSSASDMSELAIAMSKVASTANNMGVTVDQLTAQIATIVATTRVAPETVGNALKTIYARINDIKAGTDEAEISLGQYTNRMRSLGINVLDSSGRLRDTGSVMTEIGERWSTMTREQQIYLAQTMAGQRQMNNLVSLFDNWQTYTKMLNVSLDATGTLEEKNARYMESIEAHVKQLRGAIEGFQDTILDEETLKKIYDAFTNVINGVNNFIKTLGGAKTLLPGVTTAILRLAGPSITGLVANTITNLNNIKLNTQNIEAYKASLLEAHHVSEKEFETNAALKRILEERIALQRNWNRLTPEQQEQINQGIDLRIGAEQERESTIARITQVQAFVKGNEDLEDTLLELTQVDLSTPYREAVPKAQELAKSLHLIRDELTNAEQGAPGILEKIAKVASSSNNQRLLRSTEQWTDETEKRYQELQARYANHPRNKEGKLRKSGSGVTATVKREIEALEDLERRKVDSVKYVAEIRQPYEKLIKDLQADAQKNAWGNNSTEVKDILQQLFNPDGTIKASEQEIIAAVDKIKDITKTTVEHVDELQDKLNQERSKGYRTSAAEDFSQQMLKQAQFADLSDGFISLAQSASSAAMAMSSLMNLPTTWTDETLSGTQKLLRTFTILGMALPALRMAGVSLRNGMQQLVGGFLGTAAATEIDTLAKQENWKWTQVLTHSAKILWTEVFLPMLPIIMSVAAAFGLVAAGLRVLDERLHGNKHALEDAQESADKLQNTYLDVKDAYDQLKESVTSYQGMADALDQLTRGTLEWYDAVTQINDQVIDLLQKYPELAQYIDDTNGYMQITNEGLDFILNQQRAVVANAQQAALNGQIDVQRKSAASAIETLRNTSGVAEAALNPTSSAEIERLIPIILRNYDKYQAANNQNEFLTELANSVGSDSELLRTLFKNIDAVQTANNTIILANKQAQILGQQLANSAFQDDKRYQAQDNNQQALTAALFNRELDKAIATRRKDYTGSKADMEEFARLTGAEYISGRRFRINGETQKIDESVIRDTLASARGTDRAKATSETIFNLVKDLVTISPEMRSSLASFVDDQQGDFTNLTLAELEKIDPEVIAQKFSQAQLEALGFTDQSEFATAIKQAKDDVTTRIRDYTSTLGAPVQQVLMKFTAANKELTLQQIKFYGTQLQDIYQKYGSSRLHDMQSLLDKHGDRLAANYQKISIQAKNSTVDEFTDWMIRSGFATEDMTDALKIYYEEARKITSTNLEKTVADVEKIINKLNIGDHISEEDYKVLADAGVDVERFFKITRDGTYELVKRGSELRLSAERLLNEGFIQHSQENENILKAGNTRQEFDNIIKRRTIEYSPENDALYGTAGQITEVVRSATELQKVLEKLHARGALNQEQVDKYINELAQTGHLGAQSYQEITDRIDQVTSKQEIAQQEYTKYQTQLASYATSLTQLQSMWEQQVITSQDIYNERRKELYEQERLSGLDETEILEYAAYLQEISDDSDKYADSLLQDRNAARELRIQQLRLQKGIETLSSNWATWYGYLKNTNDRSPQAVERMNKTREAVSQILDTSTAFVSDDFVRDHLDLITKASQGNTQAIETLKDELHDVNLDEIFSTARFGEKAADLRAQIDGIFTGLDDLNLEVGASLDDSEFIDTLNKLLETGQITVDDLNQIFAGTEYEPELYDESEEASQSTPQIMQVPDVDWEDHSFDLFGYPIPFKLPKFKLKPIEEPPLLTKIKTAVFGINAKPKIKRIVRKDNTNGATAKNSAKGSGGGSKKKSPQQKFKAKIDPYHDVNIKLKDNEQTLKNLQKQQDKVYGGEALKNLLKQVDVLAKERDLLKEKFDINVRELHNQQEQLKGYGATFDALGRISNYESLLLSKQNQINALIDQYNAMQDAGADDDALQAINDRISALKEEYQTVESLISEYDSSSDQLQELFDNATEKLEEMLDAAQQMFYLPIEVGLDIQTREKDWLEFKRDIVDRISDDNFFGQIDVPLRNMNLVYNDDGTGMAQQIAPLLSTALQELQIVNAGGFSNLFGTDQNKAREMVQKLYDDATKQLESYYDSLEKTQEIYLDTINAMKDAFDAQLEGYDRVADTIEQDLKIAELLNGEDNYVMFQRLYDQQHANDEQRVDMRRLQLRVLQQEWAKQKELLATTQQGTKEYQDLEEQLKALEERTQSAFQTLNESLQQAIESAAAAWENAMKAMRQQTDQAFFGDRYMFDQMWEYTDWHEDTYLDPLEKANHLLDIQLDFNKEINNADEKHRKNLIALRDKIIDRLEAQEHIRESDIELAKRELEVAKAQMALEDARNNKTTMRLRRDSQGNYTYQYVADADNIADRLKDYRDAMEKYRQLAMDTVKDIRKELYEAYDESQDKLYEFMEKYRGEIDGQAKALRAWKEWMRSDEGKVTLIAEDLVRRLAAMRESTTRELQGLDSAIGTAELLKKMGIDQASAFGQALTQMLEAAGPNIWDTLINGNTAEVTQILEDKLLGVVDQFDGMYGSAIDQMATDPETTQANMTEMARRADEYAAQYRDSLERIKELSGTVFEDYAAGADPALRFNAQLIQDNEALTSGYQEMAASIRDDVAAALDELADHKPEIDALNETLQNTVNVLNTVDFSEYAKLMEKVQGLIAGRRQQKYSDDQLAVRITQNTGAGLDSSMPTYDTREPVNGNYDTNAVQSDNLQTAINQRGQLYQQTLNDAMQKITNGEIDTSYNADIAAAQQALSDLGIQRYNQYIIDQLSNIDSSMLDKLAQAGDFINQATSGDNVLNQDVHIDATFPNVQSAAEIERAFNNLVNLASQRANSNRRRNNG